jgi:hypothetical protein
MNKQDNTETPHCLFELSTDGGCVGTVHDKCGNCNKRASHILASIKNRKLTMNKQDNPQSESKNPEGYFEDIRDKYSYYIGDSLSDFEMVSGRSIILPNDIIPMLRDAYNFSKPITSAEPPPVQSSTIETVEQAAERLLKFGSFAENSEYSMGYISGSSFGAQWQQSNSQQQVDNWISVEDRLPEESGLVEICLANTQDIYISFYKKGRNLFQVWGAGRDPIIDMKTTHWKPMPKPPMYKCREYECENDAVMEEYPGNSFYVCKSCYEKLHPPLPQSPLNKPQ